MANAVQAFLIFCEDFRLEEGQKPMLLGILAPTFSMSPSPGQPDHVYLVTMLHMQHEVPRVSIKLKTKFKGASEDEEDRYSRQIDRPDDLRPGDPWGAFLPLQIEVPEWEDGAAILAEVTVNEEFKATASLHCHVEDEAEESSDRNEPQHA